MPFAGTFQSLNFNDNLVLSNVLEDISFTSGATYNYGWSSIRCIWVKPNNGTRLWLGKRDGDGTMYGYKMNTAWDIDDLKYDSRLNVDSHGVRHEDFSMSADGVYALATTESTATEPTGIVRVLASTSYQPGGNSISTYRFAQAPFNDSTTYSGALDALCGYNDNGYKAVCFASNGAGVTVSLASDTTPNNIKTTNIVNLHGASVVPSGCVILYDGQKMLTASRFNEQLHEFNFGTPYDISTLSYVKSVSVGSYGISNLTAMWTDKDDPYTSGIWVVSSNNTRVYKLNVNGSKYVPS